MKQSRSVLDLKPKSERNSNKILKAFTSGGLNSEKQAEKPWTNRDNNLEQQQPSLKQLLGLTLPRTQRNLVSAQNVTS